MRSIANKLSKSILIHLLLNAILLVCYAALADDIEFDTKNDVLKFEYNNSKTIKANIGIKSQTRISFNPYSIEEVIGDINKYKIISSKNRSSIFIIPKVRDGDTIDLTIITSSGKTQDLSLNIVNGLGKTIIIDSQNLASNSKNEIIEESKKLLKAMVRSQKSKYSVSDLPKSSNFLIDLPDNKRKFLSDLDIKISKIYRYDLFNLKGIILTLKNKGKTLVNIENKTLEDIFPGSILISKLKNQQLKPNESTLSYIIFQQINEE